MRFTIAVFAIVFGVFAGMLLFIEVGRRIGARRLAADPEGYKAGVGLAEGSVFGLLALLLGFTFSGAAQRFDDRRELIIREIITVRTAWRRIDLLPADSQEPIREDLRRYLDVQIAAYALLPDVEAATRETAKALRIQDDIWARAVLATSRPDGQRALGLVLPALSDMMALGRERILSTRIHPPRVIFVMLAISAFATALLLGYGMAGRPRNWTYTICIATTVSLAVMVILNLEYPRQGFVSMATFDRALVALRATLR